MNTVIREISRQQINIKRAEHEKIVLIETQGGPGYDSRHLPGAVPIPPAEVERLAPHYIPEGAEVIVYGEDALSPEPNEVARRLAGLGYGNLYIYRAGKQDWFAAGEPQESVHEPPAPGTHVHFADERDYENTASDFDGASAAE